VYAKIFIWRDGMGILELPEGYAEIKRINLQKDRKLAILVNVMALVIAILMVVLGFVIKPMPAPFEIIIEFKFIHIFGWLAAMFAYIICHELIHGVFIRKYSGKKAKYGFTGLYAYAGSDAYFNKSQYLVIALAPVIIFGIIFLTLNIVLPQWFWFIYLLQLINISGAAGDFYITYLIRKAPADVLTSDEGFTMIFFSRESQVKNNR